MAYPLGGASHTSGNFQRHAAEEECPPLPLCTLLAELLEIEQLADQDPPASEKPLMEVELRVLAWPCFYGQMVTSYRREPLVPYPSQRSLGRFHANGSRRRTIPRRLCISRPTASGTP